MFIGKGSFSEVVLYQDNQKSPSSFALKKIHSYTHTKIKKYFLSQVQILASINHPNIVKYLGHSFEQNQLVLKMEYIEGYTLEQFQKKYPNQCSIQLILEWVYQICSALVYLHQHKSIVHRDLKQQNIMVTKEGVIKIIDFGVSTHSKKGLYQRIGSPCYMAPQVFQKRQYNFSADIWSFGIIFYSLIFGKLPFSAKTKQQYWKSILVCKIPYYSCRKFGAKHQEIEKSLICLMKSMLHYSPQKRPVASEIKTEIQRHLDKNKNKTQ